jgi:hypothetical protein
MRLPRLLYVCRRDVLSEMNINNPLAVEPETANDAIPYSWCCISEIFSR